MELFHATEVNIEIVTSVNGPNLTQYMCDSQAFLVHANCFNIYLCNTKLM